MISFLQNNVKRHLSQLKLTKFVCTLYYYLKIYKNERVHEKTSSVSSTSAQNFSFIFNTENMILALLLFVESIFAENLKSQIEVNHFDIKLLEKRDFLGELRLNASCDSESLEAAALCEEWI